MHLHRLPLLFVLLLCACGSMPDHDAKRRLAYSESKRDTDGPTTRDGDLRLKEIPEAGLDIGQTRDKFNDGKLLYITHIIENNPATRRGCALYNLYAINHTPQFAEDCEHSAPPPADLATAFKDSWRALDQLKSALSDQVASGRYTDLVVLTMGWNTPQEEAVRNFNAIVGSMKQAAGKARFEPLVIGVTWPSMWANAWLDPLFKIVSFPYKAHDADELGLSWLAVLLHDTIAPARGKLNVIVIGHSFGSRAASTAACVGPVIRDGRHAESRAPIDHLINLQGAFLSERLFGEDDAGFHFPTGCTNVRNLVLTSSSRDTAMNKPFWGLYAGDERSYDKQCRGQGRLLRCAEAGPEGGLKSDGLNPDSNILYINANQLIRENAYQTGGGAHSDIYRRETGRLIYDLTRPRAVHP